MKISFCSECDRKFASYGADICSRCYTPQPIHVTLTAIAEMAKINPNDPLVLEAIKNLVDEIEGVVEPEITLL